MYPVAERGDILTAETFSVEDSKDVSETVVTVEKIPWHFYIMNNIKSQGLKGINLRLLREVKQPDHLQQWITIHLKSPWCLSTGDGKIWYQILECQDRCEK